jgi:hypothetical protein
VPDEQSINDTQELESDSPPELADWWVWGVRKIAALVADLMLTARPILIFIALAKFALWVFTRDRTELWGAGAAAAGFFALWAGALLLGHFSAERDTPEPERWLTRRRRA